MTNLKANTVVVDANKENEHVDYVEGASGTQSDGNIRQGVTPKPIGTTAPSTESILINVTDSPREFEFKHFNYPRTRNSGGSILLMAVMVGVSVDVVSVWVKQHGFSMMAFNEDELSVIATKLGTPLMIDSYTSDMCMQSWGKLSYTRAMIELHADIELKETIMVAMPKLVGEGFYMCTIRIDNSNLFNVLNSIENDDDLGTNMGISKSTGKGSLNVAHDSSSNTLIIDKIDKLQRQMLDGKLIFVDNDGNPLVSTGNVDSENEVKVSLGTMKGNKWDDNYESYDDDLYERS
ncbi:hypothetical protein Tco_0668654 [Tanacetum coccineum]